MTTSKLRQQILNLVERFAHREFRSSDIMRQQVLKRQVQHGRLTNDLRWMGAPETDPLRPPLSSRHHEP